MEECKLYSHWRNCPDISGLRRRLGVGSGRVLVVAAVADLLGSNYRLLHSNLGLPFHEYRCNPETIVIEIFLFDSADAESKLPLALDADGIRRSNMTIALNIDRILIACRTSGKIKAFLLPASTLCGSSRD